MNYQELVRGVLNSNESALKIIDGSKIYDAASIKEAIEKYMHYLDGQKIGKTHRVAILPSRKAEWIFFMYALMFKGIAPFIVDRTMDDATLDAMLDDMDIVYGDNSRKLSYARIVALPELEDEKDGARGVATYIQNEKLFTAHTSGTTGLPKRVNYTNHNMMWAVGEYERIYNLRVNNSILFSLPFHYCYSVIPCCLVPMALGKTIVVSPETESTNVIAKLIEEHKVNILVVNPFFYKNLLNLDLSRYDFSSLRICDSGGESIPIPIINKIKDETDVLITEGYGLTETTSLTHFLLPDDSGELRLGSVGRACAQVGCRIVDEEYQDVQQGAIGELLIKGPMVAYYDKPQQNEDANFEGWFKTGDLFYEDKDHFFYLVSRKKDAVDIPNQLTKEASINIPLLLSNEEIEDISYKFISPNELQLFVVTDEKTDRSLLKNTILSLLSRNLADIITIKFVGLLPRTATGKVLKKDL